jgi:hypothetical protein
MRGASGGGRRGLRTFSTQPAETIKVVERLATIDKADWIAGVFATGFRYWLGHQREAMSLMRMFLDRRHPVSSALDTAR